MNRIYGMTGPQTGSRASRLLGRRFRPGDSASLLAQFAEANRRLSIPAPPTHRRGRPGTGGPAFSANSRSEFSASSLVESRPDHSPLVILAFLPGGSPPVGRSLSSPGSTLQHFTIRPLTTNLCRCSNARHGRAAESPESSAACSAFWSILPPRATTPPKPDLRPHTARSRISPTYAQRPESDS